MTLQRFFTKHSQRRRPSPIRALQDLLTEDSKNLGGGLPNGETFPIVGLNLQLKNGKIIKLQDINKALQYTSTKGLPKFKLMLEQLQERIHGRVPLESCKRDILIGTGSQEVLTKTFQLVLEQDDSLLVEEYTYTGSLSFLKPYGCNLIPLPVDKDGLIPSKLDTIMSEWDENKLLKKKPKVLYTIPTGSNPTGISLSLSRRKELLTVAKKHDILILEDDPYYYLQFDQSNILPSLYSMDNDCRVVRFDSFSKILSSGLRLGFMTGPAEIVDQVELDMQSTSLHTSSMSQSIALSLFEEWAESNKKHDPIDGFLNHISQIVEFYEVKKQMFLKYADKHLTGLCKWDIPSAGFFVWIEVLNLKDGTGTSDLVASLIKNQNVFTLAGINFHPNSEETRFIRISFSTANEEVMDIALARLAEQIKIHQF